MHDRPHPGRRHLLHRPVRGLLAPRTHVVVGPRGRGQVHHVGRADHRLPRGRAGPPPADRHRGAGPRDAQRLAPPRLLGLRTRRRLGPVRRTPHVRSRLPRTTRETTWACSMPSACVPPASSSTSACTWSWRSPRPGAPAPGIRESGFALPGKEPGHLGRPASVRVHPLPWLARTGARLQGRPAPVGADPRRAFRTRGRRLRSEGVPFPGA